jgi:hypothetical protein
MALLVTLGAGCADFEATSAEFYGAHADGARPVLRPGDRVRVAVEAGGADRGRLVLLANSTVVTELAYNPGSQRLEGILTVPGHILPQPGVNIPPFTVVVLEAPSQFERWFYPGTAYKEPLFVDHKLHPGVPVISGVTPRKLDDHTLAVDFDLADRSGVTKAEVTLGGSLDSQAGAKVSVVTANVNLFPSPGGAVHGHVMLPLPREVPGKRWLRIGATNGAGTEGEAASYAPTPDRAFRFDVDWPHDEAASAVPSARDLELVKQHGRTLLLHFRFEGALAAGEVHLTMENDGIQYGDQPVALSRRQLLIASTFKAHADGDDVDLEVELPSPLFAEPLELTVSTWATNGARANDLSSSANDWKKDAGIVIDRTPPSLGQVKFVRYR